MKMNEQLAGLSSGSIKESFMEELVPCCLEGVRRAEDHMETTGKGAWGRQCMCMDQAAIICHQIFIEHLIYYVPRARHTPEHT
jgi:hypothetical protein